MIGRLKGILLEKKLPNLLVDVAGVGYELQASMYSFYRLPNVGVEVTLFTHLAVREDAQILYGFVTREERALFRALIKVSGIGPKSALMILSSIEPNEFVRCVIDDDVSGLLRLPGIGKKTAQRLMIEMRDKLTRWEIDGDQTYSDQENLDASGNKIEARPSVIRDAISALVALGYKPQDARRIVLQHNKPNITSEELIRIALKTINTDDKQ